MPSAYTILFLLLALVALSTWLIPAGAYDYVDGVPVAGSYHPVPANPQGPGDVLKAAFSGFYEAVDVCVFILMVGGFLGIIMKSGAMDAGVSAIIQRLKGREQLLIPILMLFFALGGTTFGMWEETMAFYPLLIPVFLAAGYDAVTGISVILLGAGAGIIGSTVNPFATGIAAGFAGVSLGEGLLLRLVIWAALVGCAVVFVLRYAKGVHHSASATTVGLGAGGLEVKTEDAPPLTGRKKAILAVFGITFLIMIYSVIPFDEVGVPLPTLGWWFPELSALFLVGGVVAGLIHGMRESEITSQFVAGAADLLGVAFIIGISRGISVLMNDGHITDTILHWGEQALSGSSPALFTVLVFLLYLPLVFLIPSSSGLATLSIPIIAPMAQFSGVGGDLIVTAFQCASGLVNLITPTSAVVMGALALAHVPYGTWIRHVWKLLLFFLAVILVFLTLGSLLA